MFLNSSFKYEGWTVRFGIFGPQTESKAVTTVVLVHGTPWSYRVFWPLTRTLMATERFRILLYDLAGYGESQQYDAVDSERSEGLFRGDTSVRTQAAVLAGLLSHVQFDTPPAVIAHDIAGTIALRAHLLHGCEFASLMLMDTNTILPWGDGFYTLVRAQPHTFVDLPPSIFEAVVRAVIRSASYDPKTFPATWEDILAKPWICDAERQRSFVRQIAQANDKDVAEMLDRNMYSQVRCDVKVLWGESDQWIPRAKMEKLAEMMAPRLKDFVVIPQAGHLIMIDQPERVTGEVLLWLERHQST